MIHFDAKHQTYEAKTKVKEAKIKWKNRSEMKIKWKKAKKAEKSEKSGKKRKNANPTWIFNPKITYLLVQQASTILPGDDNTRLSNTYKHKEELGDQYKVVFSQFVTDFPSPTLKGREGQCMYGGGGGYRYTL